jgi:hypothetical protein
MSFASLISFIKNFLKLKRFNNYKSWACSISEALLNERLWSYVEEFRIRSSIIKLNSKLKDDSNHVKKIWKRQKQRYDWIKNVMRVYERIFSMCNESIRQKMNSENINRIWRTLTLWKYLKTRYTSFNWAFKWIIIIKLRQLNYDKCKSTHEWESIVRIIYIEMKDLKLIVKKIMILIMLNNLRSSFF